MPPACENAALITPRRAIVASVRGTILKTDVKRQGFRRALNLAIARLGSSLSNAVTKESIPA